MAVVVVVADGDAVAVAAGQASARPARSLTSSKVPSPRLRNRRSSHGEFGARGQRAALDGVDVEPAVAVVIEQGHAPAHRLGRPLERRIGVVLDEPQPGGLGGVDKVAAAPDPWARRRPGPATRRCGSGRRTERRAVAPARFPVRRERLESPSRREADGRAGLTRPCRRGARPSRVPRRSGPGSRQAALRSARSPPAASPLSRSWYRT